MSTAPDYLVIGHVCQDIIPCVAEAGGGRGRAGFALRFGGTVTYAARTARAFGLKVAALTGAAPDFSFEQALPDVTVHCLPSAVTTTFENRYDQGVRRQWIHAQAVPLRQADVPPTWRQAAIVHLGPVAQEVDAALVTAFPGALVGVTPQGWLRTWDGDGRVYPCAWPDQDWVLPRLDALVFSLEDVGGDELLVAGWAAHTPVLVVTRGAQGATLYVRGKPVHVPAPRVGEVDPTGAGDIFAAAFFIGLRQTGNPYEAAQVATCLAAASVTRRGLEGIPTPAEVERCRTSHG